MLPILVPPFHSQGAFILGGCRHTRLLLSRLGFARCKPCQPRLGPTPPFFSFLFFLYRSGISGTTGIFIFLQIRWMTQKLRVRVWKPYRTHRRSVGYGYEPLTEPTEVSGTGTWGNTPGVLLYAPYITQPCNILKYVPSFVLYIEICSQQATADGVVVIKKAKRKNVAASRALRLFLARFEVGLGLGLRLGFRDWVGSTQHVCLDSTNQEVSAS